MRKTIVTSAVVLLLILISVFSLKQNFGRSYYYAFTKSIDLSEENVDGLYLGEDINSEKVISKYGQISVPSHDNSLYDYYFLRNDIEIATEKNNSNIIRFKITDADAKSEKGISIGSSKEDVINSYGKSYYSRLEQGSDIIGYVDKENNCSIEFWFFADDVSMIRLDYNYMA